MGGNGLAAAKTLQSYQNHHSWLGAFFIALLASGILTYPIWKGLIALKSRQTVYDLAPQSHQKKQGTPTMGGIIVLAGLFVSLALTSNNLLLLPWTLGFALIGFADDFIVPRLQKNKRGLGWKQKILAQLLLALAAPYVFHLPYLPGPVCLTAFLVLFCSNAYNFADGLDALAGSLGLILCLGFAVLAILAGEYYLLPLPAALAGSLIPFLFLNAPPAKVFMGDVGSLPIGALFGALGTLLVVQCIPASSTIIYSAFDWAAAWNSWPDSGGPLVWQVHMIAPLVILSFVLISELVPVPLQVACYKLTKKRLFPMTPIHHSFEVKGWPESRVLWSFLLVQVVLAFAAIALVSVFPLVRSETWVFGPPQPAGFLPDQPRRYHYYYVQNPATHIVEAPR